MYLNLSPNKVKTNSARASKIAFSVSLCFKPPEVPTDNYFGSEPPSFGAACAVLVADPQYRRRIERLHDQGVRSTAEFLAELAVTYDIEPQIRESLARYSAIPDDALAVTGGHCFPPSPLYEVP